jgi:hypothetical protein
VALKMHKNHEILEILKKFSPNHQFEAKITRSGEISPDLATLITDQIPKKELLIYSNFFLNQLSKCCHVGISHWLFDSY